MEGWMDGWMDGWIGGRTDGRMYVWMDGWMCCSVPSEAVRAALSTMPRTGRGMEGHAAAHAWACDGGACGSLRMGVR
eukprot:23661-Chlamydomonas_euryale.AAC.2